MSRNARILLVPFLGLAGCDEVEDRALEAGVLDSPATIPDVLGADASPSFTSDLEDTCAVVLRDSFNKFSSILISKSSKKGGDLHFTVIDNFKDTVKAKFNSRNSPLQSNVSVPHDTLNEIRKKYKSDVSTFDELGVVGIDDQLTYVILPTADCTKDEFVLILFFVDEWFYFG